MVHHAEKPIKLIQIKAVTSCSTHKIDQQETDGKNSKIRPNMNEKVAR